MTAHIYHCINCRECKTKGGKVAKCKAGNWKMPELPINAALASKTVAYCRTYDSMGNDGAAFIRDFLAQ